MYNGVLGSRSGEKLFSIIMNAPYIFRLWEDFLFLYLNIELVAIITQNWGPNNIFRGVNEKNTSEKNVNEEIAKGKT